MSESQSTGTYEPKHAGAHVPWRPVPYVPKHARDAARHTEALRQSGPVFVGESAA